MKRHHPTITAHLLHDDESIRVGHAGACLGLNLDLGSSTTLPNCGISVSTIQSVMAIDSGRRRCRRAADVRFASQSPTRAPPPFVS